MKRLIFFALVALDAWYGWHHYRDVLTHRPSHEAVVENHSGRGIERVRLVVGGQTFVRESLPDESSISFPFRVNDDASFDLYWRWAGTDTENHWAGGMVPRGPMVQRYFFQVDSEGQVMFRAETKLGS